MYNIHQRCILDKCNERTIISTINDIIIFDVILRDVVMKTDRSYQELFGCADDLLMRSDLTISTAVIQCAIHTSIEIVNHHFNNLNQ